MYYYLLLATHYSLLATCYLLLTIYYAGTAIKLALIVARPALQPAAEKAGFEWEDVQSLSKCMALSDVKVDDHLP